MRISSRYIVLCISHSLGQESVHNVLPTDAIYTIGDSSTSVDWDSALVDRFVMHHEDVSRFMKCQEGDTFTTQDEAEDIAQVRVDACGLDN